MAKSAWVDGNECIACGQCVDNLPQVFRFGADGKSECYNSSGATEEEIQTVMDNCPVGCIKWKELP